MLNGYLYMENGWEIDSNDLMNRASNCSNPYKVSIKFSFRGNSHRKNQSIKLNARCVKKST